MLFPAKGQAVESRSGADRSDTPTSVVARARTVKVCRRRGHGGAASASPRPTAVAPHLVDGGQKVYHFDGHQDGNRDEEPVPQRQAKLEVAESRIADTGSKMAAEVVHFLTATDTHRRRVSPPPRLAAAAPHRRRASPPPRLTAAAPHRRRVLRRRVPPPPRPSAAAPLRRRAPPPPRLSAAGTPSDSSGMAAGPVADSRAAAAQLAPTRHGLRFCFD